MDVQNASKRVGSPVSLEAPRAARGVKRRVISRGPSRGRSGCYQRLCRSEGGGYRGSGRGQGLRRSGDDKSRGVGRSRGLLGSGGDKGLSIMHQNRGGVSGWGHRNRWRWVRCYRKWVGAAVCLEALRATGGVERRIIGGFWEVNQGRAWAVEEPYDVASEDVGGLLDFTKPRGTMKGMEPKGGSNRQRSE